MGQSLKSGCNGLLFAVAAAAGLFSMPTYVSGQTYEYPIDSERTLRMETIGECNLNSAPYNMGGDAYEYNFNVFSTGDKVYTAVMKYGSKLTPILRRFNQSDLTDNFDVTFKVDNVDGSYDYFLSKNASNNVLLDEAGNVCLVSVYARDPKTPHDTSAPLQLCVRAYHDDISTASICNEYNDSYYCEQASPTLDEYINLLKSPAEIYAVRGDAYQGNFELELHGIHCYCQQRNIQNGSNDYNAARVTFKFKNHICTSREYYRYGNSAGDDFLTINDPKNNLSNYSFVNIATITDDLELVQCYKASAPLLFKKDDSCLNDGNDGRSTAFYQIDAWEEQLPQTDENGNVTDARYGAYPFTLGDETFLLSTLKSYDEKGPKFAIHHWDGEKTSFNGTKKLWEFPEDFSENNRPAQIEKHSRPKVAIVKEDGSSQTAQRAQSTTDNLKICTYLPGAALGVYNISLVQSPGLTSSLEEVIANGRNDCEIFVNGDKLHFRWKGNRPTAISGEIYGIDGKRIATFSGNELEEGVNIAQLTAGVYIARIGGMAKKFCLK